MPVISAALPSITGKREWPVLRASSSTSCAESSRSTVASLGRGVMTSCAVSSAKASVRASRVAVSFSRLPWLADRRTSEASSSAVRAPESSSFGSMPMPRSTAFAVPLSTQTAGRNTAVKRSWNGVTTRAVSRGFARAKFFGTSSPMIIESRVASVTATMSAIVLVAVSPSPMPDSGFVSQLLSAGSSV